MTTPDTAAADTADDSIEHITADCSAHYEPFGWHHWPEQPWLAYQFHRGRVCEDYPRVAQEARDNGWAFMGHAYEQGPIHKEIDQKAIIHRTMDVIETFTGTTPVGWLESDLTETLETPELLIEAGVKYIGDWVYNDEPTVIRTTKGPLVTLPYTVELNDIPMMIVQHHESDHLYKRAVESFHQLYEEGRDRVKIMAIAIHPYISGQPFRNKPLAAIYDCVNQFEGVLHWNGEEILDWYQSVNEAVPA